MQYPERIRKEIDDIKQDTAASLELALTDRMDHYFAVIKGPIDSPYEGGSFLVDIRLESEFPFKPPTMRFLTKVYHPNVSSQTGAICLDILKDNWSPALSLRTALISLQSLLSSPVPDDPQDAQVAFHYKRDYNDFCREAENWTRTYAIADLRDLDAHVDQNFTIL
ncbi:ubiquitin-conjugating enzyme/RWD-like protein [Gongronella butleri]|nr:ubiquitin-conjugating enzyme/RWD-like protein [Gongronella butleri]